jgi:hypothetical protein
MSQMMGAPAPAQNSGLLGGKRWEKEIRMLGMIMKVPQKMRTIRTITYTTSLSSGAIRSL